MATGPDRNASPGRELRKSAVHIQARVTASGRELAAAEFPSGRIVMQGPGTLLMYESDERCPAEIDTSHLPGNTRAGVLYRLEDQSGVSGTGVVADFVRFPDGSVVQEWRNEVNPNLDTEGVVSSGLDYRPTMKMAVQIHGHEGRTEYIYDNGEVATDGR